MSFRKVGGLQYSATQNIVRSRYNTSDSLYVTQNVGQPNSYINFDSDISGNIIIYGDLDVSGNLHVLGDIDCSGNLNIDGNIDCSGNVDINGYLHVQQDIDCSGNVNVAGDVDINGNLHIQQDIDCSGNVNVAGDVDINGYLHVQQDIDCSGNVNVTGNIDVSGNLYTNQDAYINSVRVGRGGGNDGFSTVVGRSALGNNTTGGGSNIAVGYESLFHNQTGSYNVAVGINSLQLNRVGNTNTAIGYQAGFGVGNNSISNTSSNNTFLGAATDVSGYTLIYNRSTAIGYQAIIDASNQIVLGTSTEKIKIPGSYVGIGGVYNPTGGFRLDVSGNLRTTMDASINSITVGRGGGNNGSNTVVGLEALKTNTFGDGTVAVGYQTLYNNTNGQYNIAIGYQTLYQNISGNDNVAIGYLSLNNNTQINNVAVGNNCLYRNTIGSANTSIGKNALFNNNGGNTNTSIGYESGFKLGNNTISNTSSNNTFLGAYTDVSVNTLIYNKSTAIGYQAIIDASNQIVLGTSTEKVFIPGNYLQINGTYTNNSASYALYVNGNAYATSYSNPSDYRIKQNVKILDETFTVDSLNPVTYFNKKTEKQDIGLIAHELQEIYPFLVTGEKDGENLQAVNYIGLIGLLIKEIQELKKEVKILKSNLLL